jgi:hypothetical protein
VVAAVQFLALVPFLRVKALPFKAGRRNG